MRFSIKFNIKLNRTVCTLLDMQFETLFIQTERRQSSKILLQVHDFTQTKGVIKQ